MGSSVFENVRTMQEGERDYRRFEKCFMFLDRMSFHELIKSYEKLCYPVKMVYYKDDDEYFLITDGNHRTLTAMILGAEYIKADVTVMTWDKEKKEKYLAECEFYNKYNIFKILVSREGRYKIIFNDGNKYYEVNGFRRGRDIESCYGIINRLSVEIEKDRRNMELYLKIPVKVRKVLQYFLRNSRLLQYIEKRYLILTCNENSIKLCEF